MLKGTISRHISLMGIGKDKPSIIPLNVKLLAKFLKLKPVFILINCLGN